MGSAEIIGGILENIYVGTTTIANPVLMLEVEGVPVASSYVIQRYGTSVRFIFPRASGGNIYLVAMGQTYGADLPSITFGIKVYVAE